MNAHLVVKCPPNQDLDNILKPGTVFVILKQSPTGGVMVMTYPDNLVMFLNGDCFKKIDCIPLKEASNLAKTLFLGPDFKKVYKKLLKEVG